MQFYSFFENDSIAARIAAVDEAGDLVEDLARLLRLEPSDEPGGIRVVVHPGERTPDALAGLRQGGGAGPWRSYSIANRVRIRESPDRSVFLCGLRDYPAWYPTPRVKWNLISLVVGGVLSLLSDRLFLLHGALITDGESGYVLTGPSGAGKSTAAARVPPPWRATADDLIAAVSTPGGYVLYPLPTWSRLDPADPAAFRPCDLNEPCPLTGLYFLEQSATDAIQPVPPNDAVVRLLATSYEVYRQYTVGLGDADRLRCKREVLRHVARILDRTPCGVLGLSLHGRFWEMLPDGTRQAGPA